MTSAVSTNVPGTRILVPVTAERRDLADRLRAAGAMVDTAEFIAIEGPESGQELAIATAKWCSGQYDWMAVTSRNAVIAMARIAELAGTTLAEPQPAAKVATVGEATLGICRDKGLSVTLVPTTKANASGIVAQMPSGPGRVLAPLGNLASPVLVRGLTRKGWTVDSVEAYRTVDGAGLSLEQIDQVATGGFDAVLLTSGSVAERFAHQAASVDAGTRLIAIGATTAASARAAGLRVDGVAEHPSYDGIVAALEVALGTFTTELRSPSS